MLSFFSYGNDLPHSFNKWWNLFILCIYKKTSYYILFNNYPFTTTTYAVFQVSATSFYRLGMNQTVRRINKTITMIDLIAAIVHRRPVGVSKGIDGVVGWPGVAHYYWSSLMCFLMSGLMFGIFRLPPSPRDTQNLRPVLKTK